MVASPNIANANWTIERLPQKRILGRIRAWLRTPEVKPLEVSVFDLSTGGFCTKSLHGFKPGDRVRLSFGFGESMAADVRWTTPLMVGCKFDRPLSPSTLKAIAAGRNPA